MSLDHDGKKVLAQKFFLSLHIYFFHFSSNAVHSGDDADNNSDNGKRVTSASVETSDDGKLKIKTVSDTPEIRNLSDGHVPTPTPSPAPTSTTTATAGGSATAASSVTAAASNVSAAGADSASESDDGSATNSSESKTASTLACAGTAKTNSVASSLLQPSSAFAASSLEAAEAASNNNSTNSKKLSNNSCTRNPWMPECLFVFYSIDTSQSRGKSLLESWVTTFLSD